MEESKTDLLNKSCNFLSTLLDSPVIKNATFSNSATNSVESLLKSLSKLNNKASSVSVVPEKLFLIFNYVKVKKKDNSSEISWHYCDICYEDTTLPALWQKHLNSDSHLANLKKFKVEEFLCKTCGLFIIASDQKLVSYLNSASHREIDKYFSPDVSIVHTVEESKVLKSVLDPVLIQFCTFPIFVIKNKKLIKMSHLDHEMKDNMSEFDFLFSSVISYFEKIQNTLLCTLCEIEFCFDKDKLVDHLKSDKHVSKEKRALKIGLCLLLCKFCGNVVLGTSSDLGSHKVSHVGKKRKSKQDKIDSNESNNGVPKQESENMITETSTVADSSNSETAKPSNLQSSELGFIPVVKPSNVQSSELGFIPVVKPSNVQSSELGFIPVGNEVTTNHKLLDNEEVEIKKDTGNEETEDICVANILYKLCNMYFYVYNDDMRILMKYGSTNSHKKEFRQRDFNKTEFFFNFQHHHFKRMENPLICNFCKTETKFQKELLYHHMRTKNHLKNAPTSCSEESGAGVFLCSICQKAYLGLEEEFRAHVAKYHPDPNDPVAERATVTKNVNEKDNKEEPFKKSNVDESSLNCDSNILSKQKNGKTILNSTDVNSPFSEVIKPSKRQLCPEKSSEAVSTAPAIPNHLPFDETEVEITKETGNEETEDMCVANILYKLCNMFFFTYNDDMRILMRYASTNLHKKESRDRNFNKTEFLFNFQNHHFKKWDNPLICNFCKVETKFQKELLYHHVKTKTHLKNEPVFNESDETEAAFFLCSICERAYMGLEEDFKTHIEKFHPDPEKVTVKENDVQKEDSKKNNHEPFQKAIVEVDRSNNDTNEDDEVLEIHITVMLHKLFETFMYVYDGELFVRYASTNLHRKEYCRGGDFNKTEHFFSFPHFKSFEPPLHCYICDRDTVFAKQQLLNHLQTKRHFRLEKNVTDEITFFFCNLCQRSFYGVESEFYTHIETVHKDTRQRSFFGEDNKEDKDGQRENRTKASGSPKNENQITVACDNFEKLVIDPKSNNHCDKITKGSKSLCINNIKISTENILDGDKKNIAFEKRCEEFFKIVKSLALIFIQDDVCSIEGDISSYMCNGDDSKEAPDFCLFLCGIKSLILNLKYYCGPCGVEFDSDEAFIDHFLYSCKYQEIFQSSGENCGFFICGTCFSVKVDFLIEVTTNDHSTHTVLKQIAPTPKSPCKRNKRDSHTEEGENSSVSSDEDLEQLSDDILEEKSTDAKEMKTEENIKLVFQYIIGRYLKEPFCKDCPTMFYCDLCFYSTSNFIYWDKHLKKSNHLSNVNDVEEALRKFHCKCCGVMILYEEDKKNIILSEYHETTDDLMKQAKSSTADDKGSFFSNCDDHILSLNTLNIDFISKINHAACKEGCWFLKKVRAKMLNIENPLIMINLGLPMMIIKLKRYIDKNDEIVSEKDVKYFCLDCFNTKDYASNCSGMLSDISNHLYNDVHTKVITTGPFNRVSYMCNICSTLFVASSELNLFSLKNHKSVVPDCNHDKLLSIIVKRTAHSQFIKETSYLFEALEKYLMNSYLKCFLFKNSILYSCNMCKKRLKNLKVSKTHLLGGDHPSKNVGMVILLCYVCGRVVFYNPRQTCSSVCRHLSKVVKLYSTNPNEPNGFLRRGQQLKVLSPVKVEDDSDPLACLGKTVECPVLTSEFELFNLAFSCPDFLAKIFQLYESAVYRNIPGASELAFKLGVHLEKVGCFKCLICKEEMTDTDSLSNHLQSYLHKYNTYSYTQKYDPVPLAVFCKTCSMCLISSDSEQIENHFKEHKGSKKVTSNNDDKEMWINTTLSLQCKQIFTCKDSITEMLQLSMQEMDVSYKHYSRLKDKIKNDIQLTLFDTHPDAKVYFFGSRETGLAKKHSDIDIFVDIGNCYNKSCENPDDTINDITRSLRRNRRVFEVREVIVGIRVPLVKLWHRQFNFFFDVNCLDASGVENSKLLRVYLSFDERVWWLVTAIKEWASLNCIRGSRAINSYSFVWLVLFFLMQPHVALIPPVKFLKQLHTGDKVIINDWDYSFSTDLKKIRKKFLKISPPNKLSFFQLLALFFEFYSDLKTDTVVLCPLTGLTVERSLLAEHPYPPDYSNTLGVPASKSGLRLTTPVILLDPLLLDYNVLRNVHTNLYEHFKVLCAKTLRYCSWLKEL